MKNTRTNTALAVAALAAIFATTQMTSATIIDSHDFNALTAGSAPGAPFGGGGATVLVSDADFGTQHLSLASNANGNFNFAFYDGTGTATSDVATFSFDARFNTADFGSYARLRARSRTTGNAAANDVTRVDLGSFGLTVTLDAVNHYDYVVNNSASSATIENAGGTIAANSWEIFENGVSIGNGANFGTGQTGSPVQYLTLWIQGDAGNVIPSAARVDNFQVHDTAFAIPEPSSFTLLGLGALLIRCVRRKK